MASACPLLLRLFAALLAAAHLTGATLVAESSTSEALLAAAHPTGATLVAKSSTSKAPAQPQRRVPGQMTWWQEVTNESMLPKNLSQLGEEGYEVLASEGSLPQLGEAGYEAFSSRARTPTFSTQASTREASTTEAVSSSTRTSASTMQAVSSSARMSASTMRAVLSSARTSASSTQALTRQASTTEAAEGPAASSTTAASSSEGRANFAAAAKASAVLAENNATEMATTMMSSTSSITATDTQTSTTETQTSTATLTLTTATSTQTTTSTTTEYCFTEEVLWEPLDMNGTVSSQEVDAMACQRRCQRTEGCFHFSYWKAGGYCHLQDVLALRKSDRVGFLSGPFQCWSYINNPMLIRQSKDVFIPKQLRCMEIGVTYSPAITTPAHLEGSVSSDMVSAGQRLCQLTKGCSHFSLEVSSRQYWLSGPDATPLHGVLNALSGPPVCSSDQATIFMQKKFSGAESRSAAPRPSSAGGAAARLASTIIIASFAVGLLVAGSVPLGIHFWRRSARDQALHRDRADPGDEASAAQLLDEEHADDGDCDME